MKKCSKVCSFLLIVSVLCSAAVLSAGAEIKYIRGDANNDGRVDIRDVTLVQRVLGNLESDSKGIIKRNCDLDNNRLDINDATNIQRYLAEFTDTHQIGKVFSYDEYELPFVPN